MAKQTDATDGVPRSIARRPQPTPTDARGHETRYEQANGLEYDPANQLTRTVNAAKGAVAHRLIPARA